MIFTCEISPSSAKWTRSDMNLDPKWDSKKPHEFPTSTECVKLRVRVDQLHPPGHTETNTSVILNIREKEKAAWVGLRSSSEAFLCISGVSLNTEVCVNECVRASCALIGSFRHQPLQLAAERRAVKRRRAGLSVSLSTSASVEAVWI